MEDQIGLFLPSRSVLDGYKYAFEAQELGLGW